MAQRILRWDVPHQVSEGVMAIEEVRGELECRSLPSSIAGGSVTLKAGRLKGLMGAKAMPCGVI